VNSPTVARSVPDREVLSLNCVIREASPNPVMHCSSQDSWVCSGTWLCTKTVAFAGSIPAASSWA
jgi:hypothetical protein